MHSINKRVTPMKIILHKHAKEFYKLYNTEERTEDWIDLNVQQNIYKDKNCPFVKLNKKSTIDISLHENVRTSLHSLAV